MEVNENAANKNEAAAPQPNAEKAAAKSSGNADKQRRRPGALDQFIRSAKSSVKRNYKTYGIAILIYAVIAVLMFKSVTIK